MTDKRIIGSTRDLQILQLLSRFGIMNVGNLERWIMNDQKSGKRMLQRSLNRMRERGEVFCGRLPDGKPIYTITLKGIRILRSLGLPKWSRRISSVDHLRIMSAPRSEAKHRLLGCDFIHSASSNISYRLQLLGEIADDIECEFATEREIQSDQWRNRLVFAGKSGSLNRRKADGLIGIGNMDSGYEGFWVEIERTGKPERSFRRLIEALEGIPEAQRFYEGVTAQGAIVASPNVNFLKRIFNRLDAEDSDALKTTAFYLLVENEWEVWPSSGNSLLSLSNIYKRLLRDREMSLEASDQSVRQPQKK